MASSAVMPSKSGMAMSMESPLLCRYFGHAKVAAILRRRHAEPAPERTMHRFDTAEPARVRDLGHGAARRLEQPARVLHALRFDVGRGRRAHFATEHAGEV